MSLDDGSAGELPTTTSLHNVCFRSLKRTLDMFLSNYGSSIPEHEESQRKKLLVKINSEYKSVKDLPPPQKQKESKVEAKTEQEGETGKGVEQLLSEIDKEKLKKVQQNATSLIEYQKAADQSSKALATIKSTPAGNAGALVPRKPVQFAKPEWHAPWKLMRVISGHMGWVRCVAVDPTNEWFATGAADRTVKIWDLASGQLKLTLTGHINCVRGICISDRHPYLFSVGEDKLVKCWDLEYNKVVRHYHGHLSGVYSCAIHPTLDILITGGRDSVARVWDMRTKAQVHVLSGHNNTVMDIKTQPTDPQVITGSMDTTVKLWDITSGKAMCTLTNHKKAIRALQVHPKENTFVSGGADNIKKWKLPRGEFLQNLSGHNTIINCLALNQDGVLFSGGDNGTMDFWDYKSGHCFQQVMTQVQPGSLESEAGIYASTFDHSGSRLIVGEADKTIKIWKEDELATPESHPLNWKPNTSAKKY